jgi:hypothetical protein
MSFSDLDQKERIALLVALLLVAVVFAVSAYNYINPPTRVWQGKVFETYQSGNKTWILSYGQGKIALNGLYDIQENATYVITYQSRVRFNADVVINIQKVG